MKLALAIFALLQAECTFGYEEKPYTCLDGTKIASIQVCDGERQCYDNGDFGDYDDEDYNMCVDPQQINITLNLVTQNYENGTVDLIWLQDEAPLNDSHDNISWHSNNSVHITLAGYFLTLKSVEKTVTATLEASTKKHSLTSLKPWSDYEVILRPFYARTDDTNEMYRIGRASTKKFRSPAAAPPRPMDVKAYFRGHSPREVHLKVSDAQNRHGELAGHRVRWKLHGDGTSVDGDGQADFAIDGTYFESEDWLHITLAPGRLYTLYISALNKGLNDTVIAGEELETEVATVPPEPADVEAQSMGPRSVNVIWRSVGFADTFLVAVCNGSCPPLSRNFVPSLQASYLLTYVHGSLEEQIRKMYERLQINYVLVKVDGSGEEPRENNVLIEMPFLPTNPSVSMVSCYMGKCSHAVTKVVSEMKNTPPRPISVEYLFKERGGMSLKITDPEDRNGECAGHRVRWKLHGGSTDGDGQADFGYRRNFWFSFDTDPSWVDLSLEPGQYYTLYISALNHGENNTVIVGPEISTEVTTVPLEPIEVSAESIGRNKVYVNLRSVGPADIFLVALCNGSCPPLSQDFFPSLHASYLLTNVHGPVKEQINRMSKRLHMDYVLVKVERGIEESSLHNILMEFPDTITNPTVSVACCRIDKCSPSVSTMVKPKKEGLRAPTEVKVAPVSKEKAFVSWTEPDEPMISGLGYVVTWLCQPGHHKKTVLSYSRSAEIDIPPGTTCQVWVASFGRLPTGKLLRSVLVEGV